jgi:glutamyl-tRNA synthetase
VFDNDKLAWFNTEWIRRYSPQKLLPLIEEEWGTAGFRPDRSQEEILAAIALLQPRARSLKDFAGAFRGYFDDAYEYDTAAVAKFLGDEKIREMLVELANRYDRLDDFTEATAEQWLRAFAEEKGVKAGTLINGSRVALTGQGVAPSLFAVMTSLGKGRVVKRLRATASIPAPHEVVKE